jgi:flagellar hook-basal body complex protein FliE
MTMPIGPVNTGVGGLSAFKYLAPTGPSGAFSALIDKTMADLDRLNSQADQAVLNLAVGKTDNIHDVALAVTKADLAFRTVLEIRNRLTEAYQEIMRMQV